MIKYPLGIKPNKNNISYKNRGLALETLINEANEYYLNKDIALIYKKPTPIHIVKTDKEGKIVNAYFEKKSTTDYNGLYKGKYIDFEAKSTHLKSSFPINNFEKQQLEHLSRVINHGGFAFVIVYFSSLNRFFVYPIKKMFSYLKENNKKSIPLNEFIKQGVEINLTITPRLNYLVALDKLFFDSKQ